MILFDEGLKIIDETKENGWFGLEFYIKTAQKEISPVNIKFTEKEENVFILEGEILKDIYIQLKICSSPTRQGWTITPSLKNQTNSDFCFSGYGFRIKETQQGVCIKNSHFNGPVYMHTDNLRYEQSSYYLSEFPLIRPIPTDTIHIGCQPSGPIPVIFFGSPDNQDNVWLMEGAFTQKRHILTWQIGLPQKEDRVFEYKSLFMWTGGSEEVCKADKEIELESIVYRIINSTPEKLYSCYIDEIRHIYDFAGKKSLLGSEPVYCTWNFGIFFDINEQNCIKRMDVVSKIQGRGFFQIDAGYQRFINKGDKTPIFVPDIYFPDAENVWDKERFPSGPKGFVKECEKRNLKPAIWFSPIIEKNGPIQKEKPEWVLKDTDGNIINIGIGNYLLDYSVKEVRDFLEMCIKTIVQKWGFKGIKLDFYSWMFDLPKLRYKNGGTGVFWKRNFIKMIRDYLGPEGYFLHCISCPIGNPFFAEYGFDSFRIGMDIGSGTWEDNVKSVWWALPAIVSAGKDTYFLNIDSCMGNPDIPAQERISRNAFAYITSGMIEFSGPVEAFDKNALDEYKKLCERYEQGMPVKCLDQEAFYGKPIPRILMRAHSPESLTYKKFGVSATIGFFNWTNTEQIYCLPFSALELAGDMKDVEFTDFWTGKPYVMTTKDIIVKLDKKEHLLLDIKFKT